MTPQNDRSYTAFAGDKKIASGNILDVAAKVKSHLKENPSVTVLIFDDITSAQIEIDLRGTADAVLKRLRETLEPEKKSGPGRPKMGVTAREVTLLPAHWEWLALQPGGASVTLRKLVEDARKKNAGRDRLRQAQEAAYKFMNVMAGNFENFEESLRALYAGDSKKFKALIRGWPKDIQDHSLEIAKEAWPRA